MKIINFEKKKMIPLTKHQQELYENSTICSIRKKGSNINALILGIIVKLKIIVITLLNTEE